MEIHEVEFEEMFCSSLDELLYYDQCLKFLDRLDTFVKDVSSLRIMYVASEDAEKNKYKAIKPIMEFFSDNLDKTCVISGGCFITRSGDYNVDFSIIIFGDSKESIITTMRNEWEVFNIHEE